MAFHRAFNVEEIGEYLGGLVVSLNAAKASLPDTVRVKVGDPESRYETSVVEVACLEYKDIPLSAFLDEDGRLGVRMRFPGVEYLLRAQDLKYYANWFTFIVAPFTFGLDGIDCAEVRSAADLDPVVESIVADLVDEVREHARAAVPGGKDRWAFENMDALEVEFDVQAVSR